MRSSPIVRFAIKHPKQIIIRSVSVIILTAFVYFGVVYEYAYQPDKGAGQEEKTGKESTDEALAFYTFWLMLFTGGLTVSTIGLWLTTRAGLRDQARDTRKALRIAAISAEASMKQANAATAAGRAHLRIDEITIDPGELFTFQGYTLPERLTAIRIRWNIRNFGSSPAEIRAIKVAVGINRTHQNDGYSFISWGPETIGAGLVWEDEAFVFKREVIVNQTIKNELLRKEKNIWAHIIVYYFDVFGTAQVENIVWRYDNPSGGERRPMVAFIDRNASEYK